VGDDMSRFDRYIGLPWLECGLTEAGCDCEGLLRLVYAGELGIELIGPLVRADWIPVAAGAERPLDALLLHQAPWHVGVVAGRGMMLHMPENGLSCIEPYSTGRWGRRLEGLYRHREAAV
jgi:cell wall-associated NlpC family hydrolase